MKYSFLCISFFLYIQGVPQLFADVLYSRQSNVSAPHRDGFFSFSLRDGKKRIALRLFKNGPRIKGYTSHHDIADGFTKNGEIGIFFGSSYVEINKKNIRVYTTKTSSIKCPHSLSQNHRRSSFGMNEERVVDFVLGIDRETYSKISSLWVDALIERIRNSYAPLGIKINFIGVTLIGSHLRPGSLEEALEVYRKNTQRILHERSTDAMIVITSRDLSPREVIGLAFLGSTCRYQGAFSIGVTTFSGRTFQPTLVAHELGHTLNASHTSEGIMKAALTKPEKNFSQQSEFEMSEYIHESGSCLSSQDLSIRIKEKTSTSQTLTVGGVTSQCDLKFYIPSEKSKLDRVEKRRVVSEMTVKRNGTYTVNNTGKISHFCE